MKFSIYDKKDSLKYVLVAVAIIIAVTFYALSTKLVSVLEEKEQAKMELWAEATREISLADINTDISFLRTVIGENTTIPVILADSSFKRALLIISALLFKINKQYADVRRAYT